ncbi:MAG: hypothetical protein ABW092_11980 [Candidatus Thiodiazotropha sp.]
MPTKIPQSGYIGPVEIFNTNFYVHWSFPIGGLFLAAFLGELNFYSSILLIAFYTSLIVIHELGHALVAIHYKTNIRAIVILGSGGFCVADVPDQFWARFLFYAGGIIAQVLALLAVLLLIPFFEGTDSLALKYFTFVYTIVNVVIIVINLIPFDQNDGYLLGKLLWSWNSKA